jgi:hypothetical protein
MAPAAVSSLWIWTGRLVLLPSGTAHTEGTRLGAWLGTPRLGAHKLTWDPSHFGEQRSSYGSLKLAWPHSISTTSTALAVS